MAKGSPYDEQRWNDFNPLRKTAPRASSTSDSISGRITAYLPAEQHAMLRKLTEQKAVPMSHVLREALAPYEKEFRNVDFPIPLSPSLPTGSGRSVRVTACLTPGQHIMLKRLAKLWKTSMSRVLAEAVADLYARTR